MRRLIRAFTNLRVRLSSALLALAFAAFLGCTARRPAPEGAMPPNILLILSDDQSWSPYGAADDPTALPPAMARLAREGVLFSHAFCAAPSCSPSRAAILTGQAVWRLGPAADQGGPLETEHAVYTDVLEASGYYVGYTEKGWSPGNVRASGRSRNPAGRLFEPYPGNLVANFEAFLDSVPAGKPFCFWWGTRKPHRPFASPARSVPLPDSIVVPPVWPDTGVVVDDIKLYLRAVQLFDEEIQSAMDALAKKGRLENTLVVVTSDNGMPFPCAKANLYDRGTRVPLVMWWPGRIVGGRVVDDFVSLTDLAPTFLDVAGRRPPREMTGRSLSNALRAADSGRLTPDRDFVVTAREKHAEARADSLGYPARALRTYDFLYIRNFAPERWPAGDPPLFGDIDSWNLNYPSPTKEFMIYHHQPPPDSMRFYRCFGKRPAEELYDLSADPNEMFNLLDPAWGAPPPGRDYESIRRELARRLQQYLADTGDPRVTGKENPWDQGISRRLP